MKMLKINTVAKLVKMTPDAIRFYEKIKIITPKRSDENNYREFSLAEIRTLNDCKNLKNIGFSLEEIGFLMKEGTFSEMNHAYIKKEKELLDEIERLNIALQRLRINMSAKEQYQLLDNTYTVKPSSNDLCYWYGLENDLNENVVSHPIYSKIMDHQNLFKCTVRFPINIDSDTHIPDNQYDFGLSISQTLGKKYGFTDLPPAEILPSHSSVYTILLVEGILLHKHIEPILEWMQKHNFQPIGEVIGKVLNVSYNHGTEQRIYEIWIPLT